MITETYKLAEGQFLANIEPFKTYGIPTNSILHKRIPGCGATTSELLFDRNSIIIEPNVPVITGKCDKMNKGKRKNKIIMGVYEGKTAEDIRYYLEHRQGYKKIMTTPESFYKVAEAIGPSMYTDYFVLFDECEKAIQDVDFRKGIVNPMDAFFKFTGKAFVSATPILPSDPRFEEFKRVEIQPDYDFKEPITVYATNNVVYQFKVLIDRLNANPENINRKYFVFLKSTKRIVNIIKGLNIIDESSIYCSDKSVREAKLNGIDRAYDQINDKFTKYNFLTSRFYSAVDIDYKNYQCDPIIIILSDVKAVEHSVIDPDTEAIQISGRLRKPEQKEGEESVNVNKDIFHIANHNDSMTSYSENEVIAILEEKKRLHDYISKYKPTTGIEYIEQFIKEILTINGFAVYILEDGRINYFMVDNFKNGEIVKGYYLSTHSLIEKYRDSKHFVLSESSRYVYYTLTDEQLSAITDKSSHETVNQIVSEQVKKIMTSEMEPLWKEVNLGLLRMTYTAPMSIIDKYGVENAAALGYSIAKIEREQKNAQGINKLLPILRYVQKTFKIGQGYTSAEIEALLKAGIAETGLRGHQPHVALLRNGVNLSERKNIKKNADGKWEKGYVILSYLQELNMDNQ